MEGLKKTEKATSSNYIGTVTMKARMEKAIVLMSSMEDKPPPARREPKLPPKLKTIIVPKLQSTTNKFSKDTRP